MFDGFFSALACVSDPIGCGLGWLDAQSAVLVLLAGVIGGMILGAHIGKPAVYAIVTLGVGLFFIGRRSKDDDLYVHEDPKPVRRSSQKPPPGKRVRTIFDMLGKR